uniref:NUDIX hydrolase n=1 Tax=Thermofilum pendens TaxID=2269 RepID=A0A7C4BAU4_THEPE
MGEPRVLEDHLLCEGRRVKLFKRLVSWKGRVFEKDLVAFGRSVVIVPVLGDGRVVFVKQWRAPVGRWVVELPAGRVESGEDLRSAALRELEEETGYRASRIVELGRAYVSPGYSDELITVFLAKGLEKVGAHPEEGEVLEVVELAPREYIEMCTAGECDLKSLAALLLYFNRGRWFCGS